MKTWLAILIPAAIIMILLGYVLGSRTVPQSALDNLANAAAAPSGDTALDDANAALPDADALNSAATVPAVPANDAAPAAPDTTAPPANPALSDRPPPDDSAERSDPDDNDTGDGDKADADAQAQREIAHAIRDATLSALDDGETAHWHKDGLQGDIAVSVPSSSTGGTCRTVTATMGTADHQQQSRYHVWCRTDDDSDWVPR